MKRVATLFASGLLVLGGPWLGQGASAATIDLYEYGFNIDGTVTSNAAPAGVNLGAFDMLTGLGTITASLTGAGSRYVGLFVDHEIDEDDNTFYNEVGSATGTAAAGQSWEIDEPGFVFGDIFDNFVDGTLDNSVGTTDPEDVSMAMAWAFDLVSDQTALVSFLLSTTMPAGGFYLTQTDPDSDASLYLSSSLSIRSGEAPVPATLALLGFGLVGLRFVRRRVS
jgi:hypothetical protein